MRSSACSAYRSLPGLCWKNTRPGEAQQKGSGALKKNLLTGLLPTTRSQVWFWLLHNTFNPWLSKYAATQVEKKSTFCMSNKVFWMMHKQFSGSARALCQLVRVQLMNHETHSVKCSEIWTLLSVLESQWDPPQLLKQWLPVSSLFKSYICNPVLFVEF